MSVRPYTEEELRALAGGLSRAEFEATSRALERDVRRLCEGMPLGAVGAAIHGLVCGNQPLRDFLDTLDATCERARRVV
jgi:hypothetical protein